MLTKIHLARQMWFCIRLVFCEVWGESTGDYLWFPLSKGQVSGNDILNPWAFSKSGRPAVSNQVRQYFLPYIMTDYSACSLGHISEGVTLYPTGVRVKDPGVAYIKKLINLHTVPDTTVPSCQWRHTMLNVGHTIWKIELNTCIDV